MKLEVLVSTMHQKNYDLIEKMNINTNAVIINQCDIGNEKEMLRDKGNIKWINTFSRGLSKSRNIALDKSSSDICLIADDDLIYVDDYEDIIIKQFKDFPDIDIITFQVEGLNKKHKEYYPKIRKLNYLTSMKVSSVEIAFKRKSVVENNISYNENFGAGATYQMGEENIFLTECLNKGLKILYVPIKIADLYVGNSTWFNGYNEKYFISKGAQFAAMSRLLSKIYVYQYSIRKYKMFKHEIDIIKAIKLMLRGRREYLKKQKDVDDIDVCL